MKLYAYSEPYYGIEANNKKNKKIKVYFSGLHLSSKALWKCGFSNNGKYLATYSSTPVTILFSINQYTKFSKKTPIAIKKEFNNKSFECFSPDNKNIVLSNIRYSAIYSGGLGWENATDLWIYSLKDYKEIKHFSDHNDDICFANYSEDGNKIVSRSRDGLVVLRNLN